MPWVLLDIVMMVGAVLVMLVLAAGLWRKVKTVRRGASELRERVSSLSAETSSLAARLDPDQVLGRVGERAG